MVSYRPEVYVIRFIYTEGYSILGANTGRNRDILYEVLSVSLYACLLCSPLVSLGSPVSVPFPALRGMEIISHGLS